MELRHIEQIANKLTDLFNDDEMSGSNKDDVIVNIKVSPQTLYAIDKKWYRDTHSNSDDGFEHKEEVWGKLNGILFILSAKQSPPSK